MAESIPSIYDYQVAACKAFFIEKLPRNGIKPLNKEEIPQSLQSFKGSVFDISGFDAHHVVAILSFIVNGRDEFKKNNTFYLLIRKGENENVEFEEVFKLEPNPTKQQPGNGIVSLLPKGKTKFESSGSRLNYKALNDMLQKSYTAGTSSFAEDIKRVFKNNVHIGDENFPRATTEGYMIWLFEIARRLVRSETESSTQQMELDDLPIGSAIAGLVKLPVLGDGENCNFNEVFLPKKKFHCFTGTLEERRQAIHRINDALGATIEDASAEYYAQELKQLFCSEADLTATFENLQI